MLRKAWRSYQQERHYRYRLAEAISRHASELAPGEFVQTGRFAYRKGVPIPDHLHLTKGLNKQRGVYRVAKALAHNGVLVNHRPAASGGTLDAEILALTRPDDCLLISMARGTVRRYSSTPLFDEGYVRIRNRLAAYLSVVGYTAEQRGYRITEEFVHGVPLQSAPAETLSRAVNRVLTDLARLADAEIRRQQLTGGIRPPGGFRKPDPVTALVATPYWIPAHGDLRPQNILLTREKPGDVRIIDLSNLGLHPFWYDALTLAVGCGTRPFAKGRFDRALTKVLQAGGLDNTVRLAEHRDALLNAVMLYKRHLRTQRNIALTRQDNWWQGVQTTLITGDPVSRGQTPAPG
ncbi:MAG: phosphotransferase [Ectothiorhodospiraceae bacterium]|nr:phosphotransferase [Ectothiorhodospiraceae bacterium]